MKDRVFTLELLSGLSVVCHEPTLEVSDHRFTFLHGKRVMKDIFTYRKALTFAQGVNLGRLISIMEWESMQ